MNIAGSSNGRTAAFEAVNSGSSPDPAALDLIKNSMNKNNRILVVANILTLCIIIFVVSFFFVYDAKLIGFVLIVLGLLCLLSLKLFQVTIVSTGPDIVFGVIDNGILAVMAVAGGRIAGVAGAIIGGVVGNAITDGIAGIFEGYWAEKLIDDRRTILGSAIGKMAGCLFGAGIVLVISGIFLT